MLAIVIESRLKVFTHTSADVVQKEWKNNEK